ncbi:MAG: nuclear transport factor 2 family protein [Bryobacterales bacterium]|nr:nuclear transport factor 2 family protein [Bryobacterales bacterium]
MTVPSRILAAFAVLAGIQLTSAVLHAQTSSADAGFQKTLAQLDADLFEAYNTCDLAKFRSLFADDVEFYHDQGGLTIGADKLTSLVKQNICGKTRRELVPGTLQSYPMKGIGAVQLGVHRFHTPAKDRQASGEARFVHLWSKSEDGKWKITRSISYDHVALPR